MDPGRGRPAERNGLVVRVRQADVDRPAFAIDDDGEGHVRVVFVDGRFGGRDRAVNLAAVHGDVVPEDGQQLAEDVVKVHA